VKVISVIPSRSGKSIRILFRRYGPINRFLVHAEANQKLSLATALQRDISLHR